MVERTSKRVAMPRKMRVEYAGPIYHVMSRGDRREDIFLDDVDRQDFLRTQRGGRVDAEEGGKEGLRSHEKRTKLWVTPFSFEFKPATDAALSYMRGWFALIAESSRHIQCQRLRDWLGVFTGNGAGNAWDLEHLHTWNMHPVLFSGQCAYAGAVNYAEWGAACSLCYKAALKNN